MAELSDFLDSLDPDQAAPLRRIVAIALAEAPQATGGTSYGMPALRVGGRPLVGMARATGHLSLFPFSADVVAGVADRLPGFSLGKGTIRFGPDQPIPDDVVRDIVRARLAEIS